MALRRISAALRGNISLLLFIAMEVAWIAVVLGLIQALLDLRDRPSVAWALSLYPATYLFYRLERRWRARLLWKIPMRGICAGLAMVLVVAAFTLPGLSRPFVFEELPGRVLASGPALPVLVAVASLFAMTRGWLLGPRQVDGSGFLGGFYLGIGVLFFCVFGQHLAGLPAADMLPGVIAFFALGLYGLAANRWLRSEISVRTSGQAGWPLLGMAIIALILGAGLVFWTHLDRQTVHLLLTPVFWLWDLVVRLFAFLINLFPKTESPPLPMTPQEMAALPQAVREPPFDWGETVRTIARVLFFVSVGGLVFGALLRNLIDLLLWMSRRLGRSQGISYEHSSTGLFTDLRHLLALLAGFFLKLWRRVTSRLRRRDRQTVTREARTVRAIYRGLLIWAGRRGWPKPPGQTPYEFLGHLCGLLPHLEADLAVITHSYVAIRYGSALPRPEAVRAVRDSWRRVRKVKRRKVIP